MRSRIRVRVVAISTSLTLAVIAVLLQSGGAPVSAQGGFPQSGQCAPDDTQKTTMCHVPPGRPEQAQTSCVANSAVTPHLVNHPQDCVGGCPCSPPVTVSTCAPVTVTQLHGDGFLGNARLARIESGKVPCVHVETGEAAMCTFTSGEWAEAADGNYARMGQAITPHGEPGGEWVVAARVSEDKTVPCVAASGRDSEGVAVDYELAKACAIETALSPSNATGLPLLNYATLEVCTSSYPHPDNATLTSTTGDGLPAPPSNDHVVDGGSGSATYCYTGQGAALNDRYGTERDSSGSYYPGWQRCHVAIFGEYETYAAKRPSTYLGQVQTNTPINWKPIAYHIAIANPQ